MYRVSAKNGWNPPARKRSDATRTRDISNEIFIFEYISNSLEFRQRMPQWQFFFIFTTEYALLSHWNCENILRIFLKETNGDLKKWYPSISLVNETRIGCAELDFKLFRIRIRYPYTYCTNWYDQLINGRESSFCSAAAPGVVPTRQKYIPIHALR